MLAAATTAGSALGSGQPPVLSLRKIILDGPGHEGRDFPQIIQAQAALLIHAKPFPAITDHDLVVAESQLFEGELAQSPDILGDLVGRDERIRLASAQGETGLMISRAVPRCDRRIPT